MTEGNALMRKIEGVYQVLPLEAVSSQEDLLSLATALGSSGSAGGLGQAQQRGQAAGGGAGSSSGSGGSGRSVVIMSPRVKPFMAPPPPFGRLLRGGRAV